MRSCITSESASSSLKEHCKKSFKLRKNTQEEAPQTEREREALCQDRASFSKQQGDASVDKAKERENMQGLFHGVREYLTPVLTESSFEDKGLLTPEEFVKAGDLLVYKCPTWRWCALIKAHARTYASMCADSLVFACMFSCRESGDPSLRRTYLPADKQYLVTRNGARCFFLLESIHLARPRLANECVLFSRVSSLSAPRDVVGAELPNGTRSGRGRRLDRSVVVRKQRRDGRDQRLVYLRKLLKSCV